MVINLSRHRAAIIIGLLLIIMTLLLSGVLGHNKHHEKAQPKSEIQQKYGQYLTWKEVNRLFPKYAKATITDFETQKSFNVQRRGGQKHADVQPLTAEDTAVMKAIYSGKWSWKRRAVVVTLEDGARIAASMAGMPHGQGAIRGNKFNGHFCLHFRGSKTHGSGKVDLAHQMMIEKAAGRLETKLLELPAREVIVRFFTAVDQGDKGIALKLVYPQNQPANSLNLDRIDSVRIESIKQVSSTCFQVKIRLQCRDQKPAVYKTKEINLVPDRKGWLIQADSIRPLFTNSTF